MINVLIVTERNIELILNHGEVKIENSGALDRRWSDYSRIR